MDLLLRDSGPRSRARCLCSLTPCWRPGSAAGPTLTLGGYAEAGGVRGAIARTAESVYRALDAGQQAIARNVFLRLTELGEGTQDTRRRATLDEVPTTRRRAWRSCSASWPTRG